MYKIINHPLIKVKLTKMRDKNTDSQNFRRSLLELSQFMAFAVTSDFTTKTKMVNTPIAKAEGHQLVDKVVLVPILRAGLGMVDGFKIMLPDAAIGHIGLYRNEKTANIVQYYCKMPQDIKGANVIVLDPMLATGHSIDKAISILQKYKPKSIRIACVLATVKGINVITKKYKNIDIYTCSIDKTLTKQKYISPGLGDAGDRIFKTK